MQNDRTSVLVSMHAELVQRSIRSFMSRLETVLPSVRVAGCIGVPGSDINEESQESGIGGEGESMNGSKLPLLPDSESDDDSDTSRDAGNPMNGTNHPIMLSNRALQS